MTRIGVLIATHATAGVWKLTRLFLTGDRWTVVGIVDPRATQSFDSYSATIVLITAEDLKWIRNHQNEKAIHSLFGMRLMILLKPSEMLSAAMNAHKSSGFLVDQSFGSLAIERFALAVDGYIVISTTLVEQLLQNRLRLDVAATLPSGERLILRLLGNALSNRAIAQRADIPVARVKVIVRRLSRKLWLRNRTAIAVFSFQYGSARDLPPTS